MADLLEVANQAFYGKIALVLACAKCKFEESFDGDTEVRCVHAAIDKGWRKVVGDTQRAVHCPKCSGVKAA